MHLFHEFPGNVKAKPAPFLVRGMFLSSIKLIGKKRQVFRICALPMITDRHLQIMILVLIRNFDLRIGIFIGIADDVADDLGKPCLVNVSDASRDVTRNHLFLRVMLLN